MLVVEGLIVYYAITLFVGGMFDMVRPFADGVELIIVIGAAAVSYCEYTKAKKIHGDRIAIQEMVLNNTARDCVTMLTYLVLAMVFWKYWVFFLSCSMLAGCFYLYRRRLCKKWVV